MSCRLWVTAIVFSLRFFWPPCSAVAKQLQICFLDLAVGTLGILGHVVYRWKGLGSTFLMVYHTPQNFNFAIAK